MKQYEAVIKVMQDNGGYATLGFLNQNVLNIIDCKWKTQTPFASIRRIVQDERFFFKIRPGLWALKEYKDRLPPGIIPDESQPKEKQEEYSHTYYQGLLVELGNYRKYKTFVPSQDKNKLFLDKKLSEIITIADIYRFGYDHIMRTAQTIDVIWFNDRDMPVNLFEIEHSTDIFNSLRKFVELQDYYTDFCIVADEARKREFQSKLFMQIYKPVFKRVKFLNYDNLSELHSKTSELISIESRITF